MKNNIKTITKKISHGPLEPIFKFVFQVVSCIEYTFFDINYMVRGYQKPNTEEIDFVKENVTFMFKSFERQSMAKKLYRSIQSYYPGAKVVIADDSSKSLNLQGEHIEVIQLSFNSGLSYGFNKALEQVRTPFLMRMDDEHLLTRRFALAKQLEFLQQHTEVDLVGFCTMTAVLCRDSNRDFEEYARFPMKEAPISLLLPHLTVIDEKHIVVGKAPNVFLARTDKIREVGWDNNIRMIDHHDFFYRAAGKLVSVIALDTVVFHYHNPFARKYQKYRSDYLGDAAYIRRSRFLQSK